MNPDQLSVANRDVGSDSSPPEREGGKDGGPVRLNNCIKIAHGTITCKNIDESRPFYEEFLGLKLVRRSRKGSILRCGRSEVMIVCLEMGNNVKPVVRQLHWGLDLSSVEEVDRALELAHLHKEKYGIRNISRITHHHGTHSFYFEDRDGNYWEFQNTYTEDGRSDDHYGEIFDRGDWVPGKPDPDEADDH